MWPELLLAAVLATPASAHHNKGLPHYGYFENYPQVPTEDYVLVDGDWEIGGVLFNFQGLQRRTSDTPNDVKFFVYAYNIADDKTWRGPITFDLVKDGQVISTWARVHPDEEGVFISRETLPESGAYDLVYHLVDDDGQPVDLSLPVYVDLAADRVNWPLIAALGGGTTVIFLLALAGRRRRFAARAPAAG